MNPITLNTGEQLDPQAVRLMKAIRQKESGGNYKAVGDAGTSTGAFQYQKETWKRYAKETLGDENALQDKANQNKVTYTKIKKWKDSGWSPEEIAAAWNAGEGRARNGAWKTNVGTTTINGQKIAYDTPKYVNDVISYAKKFKLEEEGQTPTQQPIEQPKKSFTEKTGNVLGSIFGGNIIGEAIGSQVAKSNVPLDGGVDYSKLSPEVIARLQEKGIPTTAESQRQEIQQGISSPTAGQIAGDVGRVALNFAPVGTVAKGIGAGVKPVLGKLASPVANVATGAIVGGAGQALGNVAEGQDVNVGTGALLGAGISSIPYVGKGLARLGSEALGASTGTGAGVINQYTKAIAQGGEIAQEAKNALRGNLNPQDIVEEAKTAFGQVIKNRSDEYTSKLSELKTKTNIIDHTPIISKFNKQLEDFGVFFNGDGTPNFSRAPGLGRYEGDLMKMSKTLSEWGTRAGDNTIAGIDKLKQVIDDFRVNSQDSRKFDTFVTSLRGEAKDLIKKDLMKSKDIKTLATYEKMLKDFETSTKEIKEIQKSLSLGDKASVDTAFRKLSTVLRTNNEIRKQAVDSLNEITGGRLIPKIAGQQLSELLPRGLSRVVTTGGTGIGLATGAGILSMLKVALFTSPRLVGELLNILGFAGQKAELIKQALIKGGISPGDDLLNKMKSSRDKLVSKIEATPNKQGGFISTGSKENSIKDILQSKYKDVDFSIYERDGEINLSKIIVPKSSRNTGIGTNAMKDLVKYADETGKKITLTPSSDYGGSKARLVDFYKRFGFVENTGKNKDFSTRELMYRPVTKSVSKDLQPLYKEAQKYKSAEEFVKNQLDKNSIITKEPLTVYRGEGKGIGNTTLVNGKYFAGDEKFASTFGNVTKSEIPVGTKIFDLDNVKFGNGIISDEALVDNTKLTDFLLDNGYKYSKNTNARGVEYVELKRTMSSLNNKVPVETFNKYDSKYKDLVDEYKTFDPFFKQVEKRNDDIFKTTGEYTASNYKMLKEYFNQVKSGNRPSSSLKKENKLEQIWKEANAKTSTKQGMTAINPLTVGAGVSALGYGAKEAYIQSLKNKK